MKNTDIILASSSPRRRELLEQIGVRPVVRPSRVEEHVTSRIPREVVEELSRQKAEDVAAEAPSGTLVIGADTVVAADGEILGKPADRGDAVRMLRMLQGRRHQVYTGVTLICTGEGGRKTVTFSEKTEVFVYPMTEEEIEDYADSGETADKAGAYGIQGKFAAYIRGIDGDYNNVVGLPVGRVCQEWKKMMEIKEDGRDDLTDRQ